MPINKTQEEIDEFLEQEDIEFEPLNGSQSQLNNFILNTRNFTLLQLYLVNMLSWVKYLYQLIDVDNIILGVLDRLAVTKIFFSINYSLAIEASVIQNQANKNYKILRLSKYHIRITNETTPSWNVDKLMVQIKQLDGTIVYPTIKTADSKIDIYFADEIKTNYKVYIL